LRGGRAACGFVAGRGGSVVEGEKEPRSASASGAVD
jgi:hypothetical protein